MNCMLIIIEVTAHHLNETCKPGLNYKTLKMPFYIILAWEPSVAKEWY